MTEDAQDFHGLSARCRGIFQTLVETYLENGSPVGSRTLAREIDSNLSSATIRNAMQDLKDLGLLESPHVSAGRIPTELGLRLFVDEFLEISQIDETDRTLIDSIDAGSDEEVSALLARAGTVLSDLTRGASLVMAPKSEIPIRHVEFLSLGADRALVVLVKEDGSVENRIFHPPAGQTPSALREAANFVNSIAAGRTVTELQEVISREVESRRLEIDQLAGKLVERGVAVWDGSASRGERLIVRGRANLLEDEGASEQMHRMRELFDDLERKRDISDFLEYVEKGEGVRIFIGSENKLFSLTGSTLVIAPYMSDDAKVVGAIGVIGPTRLNYGRIVPIVDYTAQLVGKVVSERK